MIIKGNVMYLGNRDTTVQFIKKVSLSQSVNKILVSNDPETISIYRGFYNQNFDCNDKCLDIISNNQLENVNTEQSIVFFDRIQTRYSKTDTFNDFLNFNEQFNVVNILTSELMNFPMDVIKLIDTVVIGFNNLNHKTKSILTNIYTLDAIELDKHLYEASIKNCYLVISKNNMVNEVNNSNSFQFMDKELNIVFEDKLVNCETNINKEQRGYDYCTIM